MSDQILKLSNDLPIIRHPSTGSGDCTGLENAKLKAGQTYDWTLPAAAFVPVNPPQDFWQDEESGLFVTDDSDEFVELL
jgi:hypothetical protein